MCICPWESMHLHFHALRRLYPCIQRAFISIQLLQFANLEWETLRDWVRPFKGYRMPPGIMVTFLYVPKACPGIYPAHCLD